MKKILPIVISAIAFVIVLIMLMPKPTTDVVVAAIDLQAGHTLVNSDLVTYPYPQHLVPDGALNDPNVLVGQTLVIPRNAGDVVMMSHLGEVVGLQADERAIAVTVSDSSGLAGLIRPGDIVGATAVIFLQGATEQGAFSKAVLEGMRVLYISPDFNALDPQDVAQYDEFTGLSLSRQRAREGAVVLAVPITAKAIIYDFAAQMAISQVQQVNSLELLAALEAASNAELSLYLMPQPAEPFASSGLWLPDLVITPAPTATPTETPIGWQPPTETPTLMITPTATPGG